MKLNKWTAKMSLKRKFILALLSCSLGAATFLGFVISQAATQAIRHGIEEKLNAISSAKAEEIQITFQKLKSDVDGLSNSKFVQDALVAYESVAYGTGLDIGVDAAFATSPYFKTIQEKFNETFDDLIKTSSFNSFSIVLSGGSVVSQTGGSHIFGKNLANGTVKGSVLSTCFTKAKASGAGFTDLIVDFDKKSRAYFCSAIRSKYDRDGYKKNAIMGVLVVDLNWEFFNHLSKFEAGLGKHGEIILVDHDGKLKTFPRLSTKASLDDLTSGSFIELLDFKEKGMYELKDHKKNDVYALQVPIKLDGNTDWYLVTQVKTDEENAPIRSMQLWALGVLAIAAALISIVGWTFASSLARRFSLSSDRLLHANQDIVKVSTDVSGIATSVQAGSQDQSSAIHETSAALEELTQMVARTAELAAKSRNKSENCEREAETGLGKIGTLLTSIDKVDKSSQVTLGQVDQANQNFQELLDLFNEITSKTQVINDIAFQTKLLSFNASVEAARAGEHGRGFAVVAEEVGKLAISVSGAAGEINSLLNSSSERMSEMISTNRKGLEKAKDESTIELVSSKSLASECHVFFESLSRLVTEINGEVAQIASAAGEQRSGIVEITRAVTQISMSNEDNVKNANSIFELSHRLSDVVGELTTSNVELDVLLQGKSRDSQSGADHTLRPLSPADGRIDKSKAPSKRAS
jgi:methyl-accepting chemotaxis protein